MPNAEMLHIAEGQSHADCKNVTANWKLKIYKGKLTVCQYIWQICKRDIKWKSNSW